jgi:hypothetical protein
MTTTFPPHLHDTMMACSRKLFNAAQDGNTEYATAVIKQTIETLSLVQSFLETGNSNGTTN